MKKPFVSKSAMSKIALALVLIILFQVVVSRPVEASGLGGTLLSPIVNLVVYLADGAISILQNSLTTAGEPFTYIDLSGNKATLWGAIITFVIGVALVVGAVVATVLTAGTAGAAIVAIVAPMAASAGLTVTVGSGVVLAFYKQIGETLKEVVFGNSFVYSNIFITPETLLKDQIAIFNVNFFQDMPGMTSDATYDLAITIRGIIQGIYKTVSEISIMAMLIVVVYIAIRMLMSLNPREKSRYRESFANCIVGVILIVLMHYIMSISTTAISMATSGIVGENLVYECDPSTFDPSAVASNEELRDKYTVGGAIPIEGENIYNAVTEDGVVKEKFSKIVVSGENQIMVSASNFLELARYKLQQVYDVDESGENKQSNWTHIGWAFVYVMLVILTIAFTWLYAKRLLYMAGLTMFAPIVGLMYPINKADGSRAQTLNLWLREYIGNLVIQPFHMLLYTILIGGAMAVALNNPVYVIVALAGMTFIEKLLKDLIGIQDTRIGGLGNALRDTNNAIKAATRTTRDVARAAGRTIDGAARGAVGLSGKIAGGIKSRNDNEGDGETEDANASTAPRTQQPPPAAPAANAGLPSANEAGLPSGDPLETNPDEEKEENPVLPRMLEAYDEGFGTDEWDAHERAGLARAAFEGTQPESIYSDEEFEEQLRASGYTDEEIAEARKIRNGEPQLTAAQLARGLDENGNPIAEDASLYESDANKDKPMSLGVSEDGMEMIDEAAYMSDTNNKGPMAIGGVSEDGMEMMDEAAYMQASDNKKSTLLDAQNNFGNYNVGEGDLGESGSSVQIPSFMDAETASKVSQERMAELEENGGRRFNSRGGIEAVTDGNRIVADFAGMSRNREVDPAAAAAQAVPIQKAVGQDFMPDMNKEMNTNPNLKIHTPTASAGSSSAQIIAGGASGDSIVGGGSVTRVETTERRPGTIGHNPEIVDDSGKVIPPEERIIQFNPQRRDSSPRGEVIPPEERIVQFDGKNFSKVEQPVSAGVEVDKQIDKGKTLSKEEVIKPEYTQGGSDVGMTADKGTTIYDTTPGVTDVSYTTGFEDAHATEHVTNSGMEANIDSRDIAYDTVTGVNDVAYTTELKGVPGSEHVTNSGIRDNMSYTNDIPSVSINPDALEGVSARRTNTQVNSEESATTRGRNTIDFIPPQVDSNAPEIPADQRRRIQFDPTSRTSDRAGGSEARVVTPEQSERGSRRIQFTPPQVDSSAPEIPADRRRTIQFNPGDNTSAQGNGRVSDSSSVRRETRVENSNSQGQGRSDVRAVQTRTRDTQTGDADTPRSQERQQENVSKPESHNIKPETVQAIAGGLSTAGAVVGAGVEKVGDGIQNVLDVALDLATGNVQGATDTVVSAVTGVVKDTASVANTVGKSVEYRGAGQLSDDARYLEREGFKVEDAQVVDQYCNHYKIDDKRNKALVGRMYQDTDERDKKALTKLAAQVIKAKKDGLARKDVEAYLDRQQISKKTKDALLILFEKAHR